MNRVFGQALSFCTFLIFASCSSPMSKFEPKILEFKSKFPNQIKSYPGASRTLQFAWSGNVEKPPLVFVHGSPGDWTAWIEFLLNEDLQKRFQIIAVDRPGYGGSGAGVSQKSLRQQADDLISVLQFNRSGKKAILVGHSFGGAVIAQIAADYPDKVAGLVFVASSVDPNLERTKWYQYPASWWPIRYLIPTELRVCNEEILALKHELKILEPRWRAIQAEVVTIQGTADKLVPPGNQEFILKNIPAAQVSFIATVPGMNHFVPWEHPDLILNAISKIESDLGHIN
jgi:pimeloyl-ACP methyl ester carboxylesterase